MVKFSEKGRRVLRRIYQGLGAATISLLFQACYGMPIESPAMYGMPPDGKEDVSISGTVCSRTNTPIPGIKVSVENLSARYFTDKEGDFVIYVPKRDLYELKFEDVDGPANGSYKPVKIPIYLSETASSLNVRLEADEE